MSIPQRGTSDTCAAVGEPVPSWSGFAALRALPWMNVWSRLRQAALSRITPIRDHLLLTELLRRRPGLVCRLINVDLFSTHD